MQKDNFLFLRYCYRFFYKYLVFISNICVGFLVCVYAFFLLVKTTLERIFVPKKIIDPKSIFIGMYNVSGNISRVGNALVKSNYDVDVVCFDHPYAYEDINAKILSRNRCYINQFILARMFFYFILNKKIFLFFWNKTFLPLNLDLLLLRIFRKKTVVWNCGDDVRYAPIHEKLAQYYNVPFPYKKTLSVQKNNNRIFLQRFWFAKITFLSSAKVITSRDAATFLSSKGAFTCDFPFDGIQNAGVICKTSTTCPLILHAPSVVQEKGTLIVEKAIKELKEMGFSFSYKLLTDVKNYEVLKFLKKAEIAIDYPGNTSGTFAIEAMAHKCAIIGANQWQYSGRKRLPIIQFYEKQKDLERKLRKLIVDKQFRENLMLKSFEAWKKNHSNDAFLINFENILFSSKATLMPIGDFKNLLLKCSENLFQKIIISIFYK